MSTQLPTLQEGTDEHEATLLLFPPSCNARAQDSPTQIYTEPLSSEEGLPADETLLYAASPDTETDTEPEPHNSEEESDGDGRFSPVLQTQAPSMAPAPELPALQDGGRASGAKAAAGTLSRKRKDVRQVMSELRDQTQAVQQKFERTFAAKQGRISFDDWLVKMKSLQRTAARTLCSRLKSVLDRRDLLARW